VAAAMSKPGRGPPLRKNARPLITKSPRSAPVIRMAASRHCFQELGPDPSSEGHLPAQVREKQPETARRDPRGWRRGAGRGVRRSHILSRFRDGRFLSKSILSFLRQSLMNEVLSPVRSVAQAGGEFVKSVFFPCVQAAGRRETGGGTAIPGAAGRKGRLLRARSSSDASRVPIQKAPDLRPGHENGGLGGASASSGFSSPGGVVDEEVFKIFRMRFRERAVALCAAKANKTSCAASRSVGAASPA
jgi:hypothetical protein